MTDIEDLDRRVTKIEEHLGLGEPVDPDPEPIEPEPVPPVPVPPPSGDFKALNCLRASAEQNKVVAINALRAARPRRERTATLGDIRANDWVTGQHLTWSDKESTVPKGYAQWSSNMHRGQLATRGGSYTWENIGVRPADDASQLKWGTREYNAPHRSFKDCDFTDIPQEHGLYVSNSADTRLEGCTFLRVGSQGAQWAHRALPYQQYDADNMPYTVPPHHYAGNCHFVDCALGGTRPSFNLTYFTPGTSAHPGTMIVEDCSFVSAWDTPRQDGKRSTGAVVVTPSQGNEPLQGTPMMSSVTFRNCLFDFTNGDRSILALRSISRLNFVDCAFIARDHSMPFISIDKDYGNLNGTKTGVISFTNCATQGGVKLNVFLAPDAAGKQATVKNVIDCPNRTIHFDGATGLPTTA